MKALTICQPYAHLICVAGEKRVENRTRGISHVGPLLIHAGKSRSWLRPRDPKRYPDMAFGALVGIADVIACYRIEQVRGGTIPDEFGWMTRHVHTEGPFCIVLENPRRFATPIPYVGRQGLFNVAYEVIADAVEIPTSVVVV